jgi:4-hydroxybenzoate polyprenyltransferase
MLEMIKFQHTIFALPFALTGMLLAARGIPRAWTVLWIVAAAVFARTAAMSFNRWADAAIDARNPRTSARAIPAGVLSRNFALWTAIVASALFILSAGMLNALALALSPVALAVLLGYSYTKRLTSLSHFVLGLALGIAPVGAWVAVQGNISLVSILLGIGVMLWTAGFDVIYSCQDYDIDRSEGLRSIPASVGLRSALRISSVLHVLAVGALAGAGLLAGLGWLYYAGVGIAAALLLAEHMVVNPSDPSRIELAFFTINSWVGVSILVFTALDLFVTGR